MKIVIKKIHSLYGNKIFIDERIINPIILDSMKDKNIQSYCIMEQWGLMAEGNKQHYLITIE